MAHPLIGIHAALGEIGVLAFLWVFVELLNPTIERVKRAKIVALMGIIFLFMSWVTAGYYYVNIYGPEVKPIIKGGPMPWAHSIFTETKEHVFLFLPFISLFTLGLLHKHEKKLITDKNIKKSLLILCGLIVLIGLSMAGMGYIISTGARTALEAGFI
ncbi:MAG: hypothetical protein AABW92_02140 [Nanoarchaeota archaeon]